MRRKRNSNPDDQEKETKSIHSNLCPECLIRGNILIGDIVSFLRQSGNYRVYEYKCPSCDHKWILDFYEDW